MIQTAVMMSRLRQQLVSAPLSDITASIERQIVDLKQEIVLPAGATVAVG